MDETNELEDGLPQEGQEDEKNWKQYAPEEYRKLIGELVHFSGKTVNSNVEPVGVRLAPEDAFDAPYVSARTLMARGCCLALDYTKNAKLPGCEINSSGGYSQTLEVLRGTSFAQQASPEEREAIVEAMRQARASAFSTGTEYVDHRLRQLLIPKPGQEDGYVAITPITAGGVCELLFDKERGLVSLHNAPFTEVRKEKNSKKKKVSSDELKKIAEEHGIQEIRQAQFGIGGSKPLNASGFGSLMQRPLFVDAPRGAQSLRAAFSCFHNGIKLDFSSPGPLRNSLSAYMRFRKEHGLTGEDVPEMVKATNLVARQKEEELLQQIVDAVLLLARETRSMLEEYAPQLPEERHPNTGLAVRVSSRVKPRAIRGLLEPAWREEHWERDMAWHVLDAMKEAQIPFKADRGQMQKESLVLDATASATVAGCLEEFFR